MDWKRFQDKYLVGTVLTCVLFFVILAFRSGKPSQSEVVDTRPQLQELQSSLKATEARLESLKTSITNLSNAGASPNSEVATTPPQLQELQSSLKGIEASFEVLSKNITKLANSSETNTPSEASLQAKEFEESLSMSQKYLDKDDFVLAFDMVMVASRLAPSDPRFFGLVVQFIDKAKTNEDEDVIAMAEDLLDRGDSLVHFQSPENVESSRKRLDELRQSFSKPMPEVTPLDPLDSIRKLLAVAKNSSVNVSVRSRAVEQARLAFGDEQLNQALENVDRNESDDLQKLELQIDEAEKECVKELYLQSKSRIDKWLTNTSAEIKEIDNVSAEEVPSLSKKIKSLINQGFDHLQDLMPYSKSEVEGASELYSSAEKQVKLLQRQKDWLYNQQTLRLVREIESKKEWTQEHKLKKLAEVSEQLLSPYVLRRHNELWDKVFEGLPDEDIRVWAVRLRILRTND